MLMVDGNFNPFTILNKQGHIINGNIPVALGALRFSLTQVSLLQFFSHKKGILIEGVRCQ